MKHLVFAGAGHAHLFSLSRTRDFVNEGARVTLISPGRFWYSGMGPGMVSQFYEPSDDTVDVQTLVEKGGGTFVKDMIERIDPVKRELHLSGGSVIPYDVLSLNLGSEVPLEKIPGAAENGTSVKPIRNLLSLREDLLARVSASRIVVVGGGAAGCEVCVNLWHLLNRAGRSRQITLVSSDERLLTQAVPRARRMIENYLKRLGIETIRGVQVCAVREQEIDLSDGRKVTFDAVVWAIGIRPPALLGEAGLPCAKDGSVSVNRFLQSPAHPEIFGAGDCICFDNTCLPRIGVYAVRQGPVLHQNLLAFLGRMPLKEFRPQKNYLLILNLGDGTGLLTYRNFVVRSRWAFLFKDWLDRRFVGKFQTVSRTSN